MDDFERENVIHGENYMFNASYDNARQLQATNREMKQSKCEHNWGAWMSNHRGEARECRMCGKYEFDY